MSAKRDFTISKTANPRVITGDRMTTRAATESERKAAAELFERLTGKKLRYATEVAEGS